GADQLVLDQRGRHVGEHRIPVCAGAAELASGLLVAHDCFLVSFVGSGPAAAQPIIPCEAMPAGGQFSSFMPRDRPRCASTSLISVSDFLPRFGVFNSSTSVFWIRSPM